MVDKIDPLCVKFPTGLGFQFSHLTQNIFKYGSGGTINPICAWGCEVETTQRFLLLFHFYSTQRSEFFDKLEKGNISFLDLNIKDKVLVLVYGLETSN